MSSPVTSAKHALQQALATPLEANDLGRLAQMHTACQSLAELPEPLAMLAVRSAKLLEALILNEAHDSAAGIGLLPEAIGVLIEGGGDASGLASQVYFATYGEAAPATDCVTTPAAPAVSEAPAPASAPVVSATAPPASEGAGEGSSCDPDAYVSEPLVIDLSEREHLQGFVDESREHLDAIEGALLQVEQAPGDVDRINELFRPFHTIKGIAGFLNLRDINRLTHEVETILDMGRKRELELQATTIDLIFAAIDKLKSQIDELAGHLAGPGGDSVPQPDIREIMSSLRKSQRGEACSATRSSDAPPKPSAADGGAPPPAAVETGAASSDAQGDAEGRRAAVDTSIRVDTAKLDAIVDAVGELVIAQTMVNLNRFVYGDEKLQRDVAQVTKIVRDIQESALAMRMVPIGPTFQKMRRVLRDVSRKACKQVEMRISGEETELDKNVIQAISDPLVHMVRNSVDHGIEPAEERERSGKPREGSVALHACYQGDAINIEIIDDGRGLNRDKLLAKAIERGVVQPGEQLSDQQVYQLIFAAGFSTAEQVTDISGRGVGMDVVRRNIEQLRGKIEIESELGRGSTFRIRLPLTLAIIDGMLVSVRGNRLIIPTIMIEQSLRPTRSQISRVQQRGEMIQVRGELMPLVHLSSLFEYGPPGDATQTLVVIVHAESGKFGLVVDELIGQQQVVIKSLGDQFKSVKGISGAAILGDGRVGLILEPSGLMRLHGEQMTSGLYEAPRAKAEPVGELIEA